jgi:hypothetical protein
MTKEARKQNKAVAKIRKSIRKAVDKGVSQAVVESTVQQEIGKASDTDPDASVPAVEVSQKVRKIPGLNKTGDVTLKRGMNMEPMKPDSEKPPSPRL